MKEYQFAAFSGFGIELEYAIVDAASLDVRPIADKLLEGADDMDVPRGEAAWSNELALHVIEIKTNGPVSDLAFARDILRREVNALEDELGAKGARLMPTGMHPWMNPLTETRLWPHQNNEIYASFDRIFSCQGHGWSNLQSMHINFPFSNEAEFGRLHAACRLALPLLPALAASSPFIEGRRAPNLDQRLAVYRNNCIAIPSVTAQVVPEAVFTYSDYEALLQGMYRDIAPFDPEGILQEEWLNARGAIARFDRGAIEIRVLDTQECPEQDLAVGFFVTRLVEAIYREEFCSFDEAKGYDATSLFEQFEACVGHGQSSPLHANLRKAFRSQANTAGELLTELNQRLIPSHSSHASALTLILESGTLAERLVRSTPTETPSKDELFRLYQRLCDCLRDGRPFS